MKKTVRNNPHLVRHWDTYWSIADFESNSHYRLKRHLIKNRAEDDGTADGKAIFTNRENRLYNIPFVSPYLFLHWCHMCQPITLSGMDGDALEAIKDDVTGYRKNYLTAARDRLWHRIMDGRVGILVDGPADIAKDRGTAKSTGERSYQTIYEAHEIRDWQWFTKGPRKGQLARLVLQQPDIEADGKRIAVFRVFEQPEGLDAKFQWFDVTKPDECTDIAVSGQRRVERHAVITSDPQELEVMPGAEHSGIGGLTEIPFVIWGDGPKESLADDVWFLSKAWMNLNSVLSHIIYNQGFQRSIFSGVDKEELVKMTEWSVTVVSGENAQIFTIPPGDPVAAQAECDKLKKEIHRRAKFEFNQLADDTRNVQSADSKAKDTIVQKVIYDMILDEQAEVERQIYRLHAQYEGADPEAIQASIDRDYGLEDANAEEVELLSLFNEARELGVFEPQKQVLRIRASRPKYLPTDTESEDDILKKVMDAIESAKPPAQQMADNINSLGTQLFGDGVGENLLAPKGVTVS